MQFAVNMFILSIQMIVLPRQAREKHTGKKVEEQLAFWRNRAVQSMRWAAAENDSSFVCAVFIVWYKTIIFAKTGSGVTNK